MRRLLIAALFVGCGDTGQPAIEHAAVGVGTAPRAIDVGEFTVQLEVARVAFGPAIFCASNASGSELCPAAVAELASVGAFDALSSAPQPLGRVRGFVGTVRSASYDYGITWLNTQTSPTPAAATPSGHSAHLEGTVTSKTTMASFRFVADVDFLPRRRGDYGVTPTGCNASIDERTARLEVQLDPTAWLAQIDFTELAAAGAATVTIEPTSRAGNALLVAMDTLAPARFVWTR